MITFDPVVAPLSVDVTYAVEMWVIAMVDFADDTHIGLRLVGTDRNGAVQSDTLNRLRIPPRGEAEVDHLPVRINGAPEVVPFSADPDVGLVHMPIDTCPAQVLLCALGQFRAELLNPAIYNRAINCDIALCQKIDDILIRQRVSQISPDSTENDLTRKTMMFER